MVMLVPMNVAPWLWGWPHRFLSWMASVNSVTFLVGPYHGGDFSTGVDTPEQVLALPRNYSGGIMTNEPPFRKLRAFIAFRLSSRLVMGGKICRTDLRVFDFCQSIDAFEVVDTLAEIMMAAANRASLSG